MSEPPVAGPAGGAETASRVCPKCGRACGGGEIACARCGLAVERFGAFEQLGSLAGQPALDDAWAACCSDWTATAAHDAALDLAARLACLPNLARRYRERLAAGPDAIADKRLQQITVLIETVIRAQVKRGGVGPAARAVWLLGYAVATIVMLASAWVFFIAIRHRG